MENYVILSAIVLGWIIGMLTSHQKMVIMKNRVRSTEESNAHFAEENARLTRELSAKEAYLRAYRLVPEE